MMDFVDTTASQMSHQDWPLQSRTDCEGPPAARECRRAQARFWRAGQTRFGGRERILAVCPSTISFPVSLANLLTSSLYALQLLSPASIFASLAGRPGQLELDDVDELGELSLDAKTSARAIGSEGGYDGSQISA